MSIVLMVSIMAISTTAVRAQDQQLDTAKLKADAENMVNIISGDKPKIQTYCEILDLTDQIDDASVFVSAEFKSDATNRLDCQRICASNYSLLRLALALILLFVFRGFMMTNRTACRCA